MEEEELLEEVGLLKEVELRDDLSGGPREPLKIFEEGREQAELEWTGGLEAQQTWQGPGATWL